MTYGPFGSVAMTTGAEKARREFIALAAALIRQSTSTDLAVTRALDIAVELERRNIAPWQTTPLPP